MKCKNLDCSGLKKGMVVKNYTELCCILGQKVLQGNSKKYQMQQWECYFRFTREGHKFIIEEVYKTPKPQIDGRRTNNGIYIMYIEQLLMEYLSNLDGYSAIFSKYGWCTQLGMTNENFKQYLPYTDYRYNDDNEITVSETECKRFSPLLSAITQKYNISASTQDAMYFYENAQSKLYGMLNRALKSMEDRFLIKCSTVYCIQFADGANLIVEGENDALAQEVLDLKNRALADMGYKTFSQVIENHRVHIFYKKLKSLVQQEHTDTEHPESSWVNVYERTKIIFLKDSMKKQIRLNAEKIAELSYEQCKKQLNDKVVYSFNSSAKNSKVKFDETKSLDSEIEAKTDNSKNGSTEDFGDWGIIPKAFAKTNSYGSSYKDEVLANKDFTAIQNSLIDYLIRIE